MNYSFTTIIIRLITAELITHILGNEEKSGLDNLLDFLGTENPAPDDLWDASLLAEIDKEHRELLRQVCDLLNTGKAFEAWELLRK